MKPANLISLRAPAASRGVTLVELLVSVAIGLALTVVIAQLFLGSRQTFATTDDLSRMQENVRFAQMLFARTIHLAGYKSAPNSVTNTVFAAAPVLESVNGVGNASDSLTVRFQGSGVVAGAADGSLYDCLGVPVTAGQFAVNAFTIGVGANGRNALLCNGIEMVADVDNMQVMFGEDTDGDLVANNYLHRGDVVDLNRVVSVRIALMFSTASNTAKTVAEATRTYDMLGDGTVVLGPYTPATTPNEARRIRRVVVSTYNLRNRTP
jgi:type IV pilus assembly protein PilW